MTIDPTREEWQAARARVASAVHTEATPFTTVETILGPCPPEPPPAPLRRHDTRLLVWTNPGGLHIPGNILNPDEAEAMAAALMEHARYAREQEAA